MTITVEALAGLANRRELPMLPEREWEARTKINPTAHAIAYHQALIKQRAQVAILLRFAGACALLFAVSLVMLYLQDPISPVNQIHVHVLGGMVAVFGVLASAVTIWAFLESRFLSLDSNDEPFQKSEVEAFCRDLDNLQRWLFRFSRGLFWQQTDEELKLGARQILMEVTTAICRLQMYGRDSWDNNTYIMYVKLEGELVRRYDTLQRLGLASGGYKKYFAAAALDPGAPNKLLEELKEEAERQTLSTE